MSEPAFLGSGWSFPPQFSRTNASVVMRSGVACIRDCLTVLFSTAWGERTMLAAYGSPLNRAVFRDISATTANDLIDQISSAIVEWEPRIDVNGIEMTEADPEQGLLQITVDFTVRETNVRSNFVYPFYQREATITPSTT